MSKGLTYSRFTMANKIFNADANFACAQFALVILALGCS